MPSIFRTLNPATEELLEEFDVIGDQTATRAAQAAAEAFAEWRALHYAERGHLFRNLASLLRKDISQLASTVTTEMGKPVTEAEQEVEKCAFGCEFFADNAESFLSDTPMPSDSPHSKVVFEPLGTVLAIMPWNFPFWQVFRFGAPALMAGNTMILKHAPNVPRCANAIADAFSKAGFPEAVFQSLFVDIPTIESLIAHPSIRAVTLTGSDRAGSQVSAIAGRHLKKSVMELGGSDPFIVMGDAELGGAVDFGVRSRFQNAGQSCIAAKRFILDRSISAEYESRFVEVVEALEVGDPADRSTKIGPLARDDLRENLERQVAQSVEMGAKVLTGGKRLDRKGYFFAPTVLTDVTPDMPVAREEVFGPVAVMLRAADDEEMVSIANRTEFGLGGNVWSSNPERAEALARRLYTGGVFINGMTHSDPRIPFGGVGRSGWGRELSSFGIREFVNIKTVWKAP